jgi:UPF0755 protein
MATSLPARVRGPGALLLALILTAVGIRASLHSLRDSSPDAAGDLRTVVYIKPKTGVQEIARILQDAGVIQSRWVFLGLAVLQGSLTRLHAGEYEFARNASLQDVLRKLEAGRVITHQVTVPEGFTAQDIARLLEGEQLVEGDRFMALVESPSVAASLGLPGETLEGYLFPDTYRLTRGMGEEEIIRVMVARFRQALPPDLEAQAGRLGLDIHAVVTLASLIEKETRLDRERSLVSAVFHNRLQRNMPLQSDPTAVYGAPERPRRISAEDLRRETPYNTYLRAGLPPGPIANPGLASLQAALNPARVSFLYFVAKNDGSHFFSRTLEEHTQAVRKYQMRSEAQGTASRAEVAGIPR